MVDLKNHYLYPSELFAEAQPYLISTILGSCVSVCLYDKKLHIGGMNHFMLPLWNGNGLASPRYGNIAIEKLINRMLELGCRKINLTAKVFGGGEVLNSINNPFSIGSRNIVIANELLQEHGIIITAQSTGGKKGRKIIFNSATNEIRQKYIGDG